MREPVEQNTDVALEAVIPARPPMSPEQHAPAAKARDRGGDPGRQPLTVAEKDVDVEVAEGGFADGATLPRHPLHHTHARCA